MGQMQRQGPLYKEHQHNLETCRKTIIGILQKYIDCRTSLSEPSSSNYKTVTDDDGTLYYISSIFLNLDLTTLRVQTMLYCKKEINKVSCEEDATAESFLEAIEVEIKKALIDQNIYSSNYDKPYQFFHSIDAESSSHAITALQNCIRSTNCMRTQLELTNVTFEDVRPPATPPCTIL